MIALFVIVRQNQSFMLFFIVDIVSLIEEATIKKQNTYESTIVTSSSKHFTTPYKSCIGQMQSNSMLGLVERMPCQLSTNDIFNRLTESS
jgi:hypothetical protein